MRCRWMRASPLLLWRRRVGRAFLTSNCAPDRLRRLSVNADECPPHVFGVTEADRLRDAFDRFGSRFYAAAGQIDAEPFHEHEIGNGTRRSPLTPFTTRARERRVGGGASEWSLGRTLRGAAEPPGDA